MNYFFKLNDTNDQYFLINLSTALCIILLFIYLTLNSDGFSSSTLAEHHPETAYSLSQSFKAVVQFHFDSKYLSPVNSRILLLMGIQLLMRMSVLFLLIHTKKTQSLARFDISLSLLVFCYYFYDAL